jgi:hypothetical protein
MNRIFKIHASQCWKIMGRIGLTDKQIAQLDELEAKATLTKNQQETMYDLRRKRDNPELPQTCITFLKEWYADDQEQVYSKYLAKGIMMEQEAIDLMARVLGYGVAEKNQEQKEDAYFIGTCDVKLDKPVVDVKCPWDKKSFLDNTYGMDPQYIWQGRVYMPLYKKKKFILFYGLMDTPAELNNEMEVVFSDLPDSERWIAYQINHDPKIVREIRERVKLCRKWLAKYDKFIKANTGKILTP